MLLFSPLLKTTSGQSVSKYRFSSHLLCPWLSALDCLGYFPSFSCVKFEGTLKVFLEPYLFSGGMLVCWLLAALPSCCFFSSLSRVVSGADSVCFLFHMQHQIPVLLWWICSTEVLAPWLLEPIPPTNAVVFVLSMSNFSVGLPSSFYTPSIWLRPQCCLSFPPSSCAPFIHPTFTPPTGLISPPAFLQQLLSAHVLHHSYPSHVIPPFTLSLLQWGLGVVCWGSEWGGLPDKLRFRRAENEGEGQWRQCWCVCVLRVAVEIAWCSTCSGYFSDCLFCSVCRVVEIYFYIIQNSK